MDRNRAAVPPAPASDAPGHTASARGPDEASRAPAREGRIPAWAWLCIAPAAAATLIGIHRGASLPPSVFPIVEYLHASVAVVLAASASFGCALLSRARAPLAIRLSGCVAQAALALAIVHTWGGGLVVIAHWHRVQLAEGPWSVELPAEVKQTTRHEPELQGEATIDEVRCEFDGVLFQAQSRLETGLTHGSQELWLRARTAAAGDASIVLEKEITVGELRGLDLVLRSGAGRFHARVFVREPTRLWLLRAGPLSAGAEDAERFVGSFSR
ncbi:MAG: hypothetical protein JST92_16945 [Deltaproteobacteria bacterium]|nr:hypothetical protein [Deltaproteobacteria bacterium]